MNAYRRTDAERVLRVGLIVDGRIFDERIVGHGETLTIGSSERCDLIVPASIEMPLRHVLFEHDGDAYSLRRTGAMHGRIGDSAGPRTFAGGDVEEALSLDARGKVSLGTVVVLFQMVDRPPEIQRAQLPASARSGLASSVDWLFTSFVVFSYMLFFGFVVYLENADWQLEQPIDAVPDLMARLVFEEPAPPPEPPTLQPDDTPADDAPEQVADAQPRDSAPTDARATQGDRPSQLSREDQVRLQESAARTAEQMMLVALGEDSAFENVLMGGAPTQNAAEVLADVEGVEHASRSERLRERQGRRDGSGHREGLGVLVERETREVETDEVVERTPRGLATIRGGTEWDGEGDLPADVVSGAIRRQLRGVQRCYERLLPQNPSLGGKVTVEFRVQPRGNVTGVRAVENNSGSDRLAGCITGLIGRIRIHPGPEGGSVSFRYPFIFAPQN